MPTPTIIEHNSQGKTADLVPTTVRELGKDEQFLEDLIAAHPALLELETNIEGVKGPFRIFSQNDFVNALDKSIIPDLTILCASGHVIIVEVKLSDNPELRDRKVIAQILDYAAAFVDRSAEELCTIFSRRGQSAETWEQLIECLFPEEEYIDILADRLAAHLQRGEVNLIVACDKAPPGLSRFLSGISRQSALPFSLSLAEITPYVSSNEQRGSIFFVSKIIMRTDVVSRTAVTVRYEQGSNERPSVKIETTPMEEIEQNIAQSDNYRFWSKEDIEEAVISSSEPIVNRLFELARTESNVDQIMSSGKKRSPAFGFYLRGIGPSGKERTGQVFNYRIGDPNLRIYMNMIETMVSDEECQHFAAELKKLFPKYMDRDLREPWVPLKDVEEKFDEFREIIRSLGQ